MRFQRVLVATDFSEAVKISVEEARPWIEPKAAVQAVHVLPHQPNTTASPPNPPADVGLKEARRRMTRFLKETRLEGSKQRFPAGLVSDEIRVEAKAFGADLLVLGACHHLPSTHLFVGSQSRALLTKNAHQTNVFIGRRTPVRANSRLRVVVATDFSPHARAAADRITGIGDWPATDVFLVHALETGVWLGEEGLGRSQIPPADPSGGTRTRAAGALANENQRAFGGKAREHVLVGDPAKSLLTFARDQNADLVVVGTSGRALEVPVILGSVASEVAENAPCSVLVVHG